MQKGNLLLFVASLGIVWEHASSTSAGYCCPQITVALGTEDDGTYNFLAEGKGPAMKECQDACIYSKDSNQTDLYCFEAVTSDDLGNGQVQCEAISPYSLVTSTTPAVTGPTAEDLLKKIENLQKDLADQTKKTEVLEKDLADQTKRTEDLEKDIVDQTKKTEDLEKEFDVELKKEVEAREAEVGKIKTEVNSIDGRLNKAEKREAVCGYLPHIHIGSNKTLTFEQVYDEVDSSSGGELKSDGYFKAGTAGIYLITFETTVQLDATESLVGKLKLSSGNYAGKSEELFIDSLNSAGDRIRDQASASRYVKMAAGETLHIELHSAAKQFSHGGVSVWSTTMCVSLYSASG